MTNLIILLVMLTVLLGAGAYGVISSTKMLQANIEKLMIEDRLEEAAQGVLNNIVSTTTSSTQTYNIPAPDNLASPAVPSWITANAQTPRGIKFLYCPFSNISGSGSTITTPSGSYAVTIGTLYSGSQNYVTASDARPANANSALAIIVAPGPNQSTAPDCQNVTSTGTLAGAQVRIITEAEVQSRAQVTSSVGNEIYASTATTGDGTGRNSSNYATFQTAMNYLNQYRPQAAKLDMDAQTFNADTALMGQTNVTNRQISKVRNHSILFSGSGPGNTIFQNASAGAINPYFIGSIEFQNLGWKHINGQLYRPIATPYSNIILDGTNFQFVGAFADGGAYIMGNNTMEGSATTSATGSESTVAIAGGQLYFGGNTTAPTQALQNYFLAQGVTGSRSVFGANSTYTMQGETLTWQVTSQYACDTIFQGTITQGGTGSNSSNWGEVKPSDRVFFSGATFNNVYEYFGHSMGLQAFDRGTTINYVSGASRPPYTAYLWEGPSLLVTNSTFGSLSTANMRPSAEAINFNSSGATNYGGDAILLGGGSAGGWPVANVTGGTSCALAYNVTTSYHMISDSALTNSASSFLPRGSSSYEPLILLNRAGWTCTR